MSRRRGARSTPWALRARRAAACVALLWPAVSPVAQAGDERFDLVIVHGRIIDGTGSPWYSGDLGIRDGRIAAIRNLEKAARAKTIDAHGEVVAPGFIHMLRQSEPSILVEPRVPSNIVQGHTTEISGWGNFVGPLK